MFHDNLIHLRKLQKMTQEDLAEALGCSRQTISKWETGESLPDLKQSRRLAELFGVSLDDLADETPGQTPPGVPPKGKHAFGFVKVGDRGQIVLPARARRIFGIQPGDHLIVLGDENQGLAIIQEKHFLEMFRQTQKAAEL